MQRSEALDLLPVGALTQTQTEHYRRLALATGFRSQAVWNRSTRSAGARGGARLMKKKKRGKTFVSRLSFQIVVK